MSRLALLALLPAAALAWSPFEKNHPVVEEGTQAYEKQDFDKAAEKYDAAAKERPKDANVEYDRALALHKQGKNAEAREAFKHAEELDTQHELTSRIHYNLGNVEYADGHKAEAVQEYRKALRADPRDELARHNLEIVLRDLPPKTSSGSDGGTPDGGKSDAGRMPDAGSDAGRPDGGFDGGTPDAGQRDGGGGDAGFQPDGGPDGGVADGGTPTDGGQGDGGRGDGGQGEQDQKDKGDAGQSEQDSAHGDGGADGGQSVDAGEDEEPQPGQASDGGAHLSKKEAEKLLDSLKSNEKNLQLWRFRQKTKKNDTHGKDW